MGLLKPMAIHENGYREYASSQIETMDMIRILQAAGFTLKQIREIITGGAEIRRTSLFGAVGSIENKIHELFSVDTTHQISVMREDEKGFRKEGTAIIKVTVFGEFPPK